MDDLGREPAKGGPTLIGAVADSMNITSAAPGAPKKFAGYVLLISEIVVDDLDDPVRRIVYRADPEQARALAALIVEIADRIESEQ